MHQFNNANPHWTRLDRTVMNVELIFYVSHHFCITSNSTYSLVKKLAFTDLRRRSVLAEIRTLYENATAEDLFSLETIIVINPLCACMPYRSALFIGEYRLVVIDGSEQI